MDDKTRAAHVEGRPPRRLHRRQGRRIEPALIDALNTALTRLEKDLDAKPAMNGFEGHRTVRIYNLLAHGAPFEQIPVHPNVLPVIEGVLDTGCLISSSPRSPSIPAKSRSPFTPTTWSSRSTSRTARSSAIPCGP